MNNSHGLEKVLDQVANMQNDPGGDPTRRGGDRRDGRVYSYGSEIVLALQVALVTARPLLLSGPPGCGKSSLAGFVARNLGFGYYEYVSNDDSTPQELLWRLDVVRRLNDAQTASLRPDDGRESSILDYVEPGPLWWSLNPSSARSRGRSAETMRSNNLRDAPVPSQLEDHVVSQSGAVLLIDEIDKADSAFCNGLLVPLGSRQFSINEADVTIHADETQLPFSPLVIITTNNERELPDAFVRRCISLAVPPPDVELLKNVATMHYPEIADDIETTSKIDLIADKFFDHLQPGHSASTAEFLDLVAAMLMLEVPLDSEEWRLVERLVIEKPDVRGGLQLNLGHR